MFLPAEKFILTIVVLLLSLDGMLAVIKGTGIDLAGYGRVVVVSIVFSIFLLGLGQFYRFLRPDPRISAMLVASGLFLLFMMSSSIFNYMLLPLKTSPIDLTLAKIDAALGFDWPSFLAWVSTFPLFARLLPLVYVTALWQIIAAILVLGICVDILTLHRFLLTGILGALLTILFWALFPSFGTSTIYTVPDAVLKVMPIIVDSTYGAELVRLGREGIAAHTSGKALGLIAFPSFHMVMACMSVCFLTRVRWLGPPIVTLNLWMIPATIVQGGHHLVDVFGGVATFFLAYWMSGKILSPHTGRYAAPLSLRSLCMD